MKKKGLILSLIGLLAVCSLIGGTYLVNASDEGRALELMSTWCKTIGNTSEASFYGSFSASYNFSDAWNKGKKIECSPIDGNNVSCNYSLKTNGMYKLAVDYNDVSQYVMPDQNGYISFNVVASPGTEIRLSSYPIKVSSEKEGGVAISDSCKVNGIKDNMIIENGNDVDPNREYAIFNVNFSQPATKENRYPNSGICKPLENYKTSSYSSYIESAVPECFSSTKVINIATTDAIVSDKVTKTINYVKDLVKLSSDPKTSNAVPLYCQFDADKNKNSSSKNSQIKSYTSVENIADDDGKVWYKVSCTEDMTIQYDTPKASYTSGGFKYTVKLNSSKKCTVYPVRTPNRPLVCTPDYYFSDHNTELGGPNEDFTQCVASCDGGKYTDECSNKCYFEVYDKKHTINQISFMNTNKNTIQTLGNIEKTIYIADDKNSDCYVGSSYEVPPKRSYSAGRTDYFRWQVCPSARTLKDDKSAKSKEIRPLKNDRQSIGKKIGTNSSGLPYGCVYGWQSNTCSGEMVCDNKCPSTSVETEGQAEMIYQNEVKYQNQAKKRIKEKYGKCTENKNGTFTCSDENTTEDATKNATITRTVKNKGNDLADNKGFVNFDGNSAPTISYNTNKTNSFINFPKSFISLENGKILYRNQENADMLGYIFGGYLFYTDPNTTAKDTNNIRYYPEYAESFGITDGIMAKTGLKPGSKYGKDNSLTIDWNIVTQIRNFGSYKQWNIDVNCFYGADVSKCGDDPDKPCDSDPNCPTGKNCDTIPECKGGNCIGGNLPYRYRTVNLSDLFPEREEGYNWQENNANKNASTSSYNIDPTSLISDIESKGNGVYNNSNIYTNLAIGKNGINWKEAKNSGLYTEFEGSYKSQNGISFYNSKYVANNKQNTNRTK